MKRKRHAPDQIIALLRDAEADLAGTDDDYTIAPRPYLTQTLAGQWGGTPSYSGGTGLTTFTASGADFQGFMNGWSIIVNLEQPVILTVHEVTGTTVKLKGDCTALAASGDYWLLSPPPGVNPQTGTLASIDIDGNTTWHAAQPRLTTAGAQRPNNPGTFLWAHYRYLPPMAGFTDDEGQTIGEQGGANKLGNYHCRNRVYDILQGRWTSLDPTEKSWARRYEYAGSNPISYCDPSGLQERDVSKEPAPELQRINLLSRHYWNLMRQFREVLQGTKEDRVRETVSFFAADKSLNAAWDACTCDRKKSLSHIGELDDYIARGWYKPNGTRCISELTIVAHGNPDYLEGPF